MGIVGVQPPQVAGLLASAVNRGQGTGDLESADFHESADFDDLDELRGLQADLHARR